MDPTCLMAWVWWRHTPKWPPGASELRVVVKNLTATLITIAKGIKVAQVVAANAVPQVEMAPRTLEKQLIWPGWVVQGKFSGHLHSVSWIPWHFLLGAWRLRQYWPSKIQDQNCWWWTLQRVILKDSPTHGGWGPGTCEGDVGSGCYSPESKPMV